MSIPHPVDPGKKEWGNISLHGSCATRVLVLIDIADWVDIENGANDATDSALFLDRLRLSVLRVLTQLCLSCPQDSWVEWAPRLFDSRHGGVGKTPAELSARLRSRRAAQGTRGFTRVSRSSFEAFGDAALAVACGTQGDPLLRDREAALRRWNRGRKKQALTWAGQEKARNGVNRRSKPIGEAQSSSGGREGEAADFGGSWEDEDGPIHMYDGHDMSSHEVVVRSLLEVLQELGEAAEGDRTAASLSRRATIGHESPKLQLLLLLSAFPSTDEDVERFCLQGNFTAEATAAVADKPSEQKSPPIKGLLDAQLGKAVLRAASKGVSFLWQDRPPSRDTVGSGDKGSDSMQREGYLYRCLSATDGFGVLRWERVVESTTLLPPCVALGGMFARQRSGWSGIKAGGAEIEVDQRNNGVAVPVALNRQGVVDASLVAYKLSSPRDHANPLGSGHVAKWTLPRSIGTEQQSTPWRLMGTVPIGQIWPSCLVDQGWGSTVVLRAESGSGAQRWRELLKELLAGDMAASIALPPWVFGHEHCAGSDENIEGDDSGVSELLTVALMVPVTGDCAVGWNIGRRAAMEEEASDGVQSCAEFKRLPEQHPWVKSSTGVQAGSACYGSMRAAELTLEMRAVEVGRAMQKAELARKRRRQAKAESMDVARGMNSWSSSLHGASERGARSGGHYSHSPKDSASLSLSMSGDGGCYNARQWRLEMASEASHDSSTPRGCRLFEASTVRGGDEDEPVSSTGSSSGPRRALHQALEETSPRSSLLGLDTDSLSTPGSKEGSGCITRVSLHRRQDIDVVSRGEGRQGGGLFPFADDTRELIDLTEAVVNGGANELPLSFMSEPALVCLPRAYLPNELISLTERCAGSNEHAAAAVGVGVDPAKCDVHGRAEPSPVKPKHLGPQRTGRRKLFVDAMRCLQRRKRVADPHRYVETAAAARAAVEIALPANGDHKKAPMPENESVPKYHVYSSGKGLEKAQSYTVASHNDDVSGEVCGFNDRVSRGVSGLLRQYGEVVDSGQRSPIDFVVRTVPEGIREMTDDTQFPTSVKHVEDRNARAAQVLVAVVSGLISTPKELSAKHRANKCARSSGIGADAAIALAKPAMQKIRDYQLQALLLCQLHTLAMDLPDAPGSLAAFSALAMSGGVSNYKKGSKGKGKAKGKKRRRKDSGRTDGGNATERPSDPLPDIRRILLVDYLQPISTMLDACTVTRAPASNDSSGVAGTKGGQARAYDGTLADFMGLALVKHFASRLPRTLAALFEDFECHPPDSLAAALEGTLPNSSSHCAVIGGANEGGDDGGIEPCKESTTAKKSSVIQTALGLSTEENNSGNEPAGANSALKAISTATGGILLSDRTTVSHNHFKMSGVLNGFREVKLKAHTSSGGLRPSVLGRVSGNDQSGCGAHGGKDSREHGGWRMSTEGGSGRGIRSRAARDAKQIAGLLKIQVPPVAKNAPTPGVRHSPRLNRKRPCDRASDEGCDVDTAMASVSRGQRFSSSTSTTQSAVELRKRRQMSQPSGVISKPRAGVFVEETPQKGLGDGTIRRGRCSSRNERNGKEDVSAVGSASSAVGGITGKFLKLTSEGGHVPDSSTLRIGSPAAGAVTRRRPKGPASPEDGGRAGLHQGMPSPPSCRSGSAASRLFVAESPGVSIGIRGGRGSWARVDSGGEGDRISRKLVSDSISPTVTRGRAVVPDTPA